MACRLPRTWLPEAGASVTVAERWAPSVAVLAQPLAIGERLGRPIDKLNTAAIGNVTAQLHVHILGRRRDDPLWPDPVWGRGPALPYSSVAMVEAMDEIAAG